MEDGSKNGGLVACWGGATIVVDPLYCAPYLVDLTFTKKAPGVKSGHLAVVGAHGNVLYKVERRHLNMRDRKLLLDPSDRPILLVQSERKTSRAVYDVFRGDSRDAKDLLFKIKKVSEVEVQVFLAANVQQYYCDFRVWGDINNGAVTVFRGNSADIAARMSNECKFKSEEKDESAFGVAVSPNVDSCFIAALFSALHGVASAKIEGADRAETYDDGRAETDDGRAETDDGRNEKYGNGDGSLIAAAVVEGATIGATESVVGKLMSAVSDFFASLGDEI